MSTGRRTKKLTKPLDPPLDPPVESKQEPPPQPSSPPDVPRSLTPPKKNKRQTQQEQKAGVSGKKPGTKTTRGHKLKDADIEVEDDSGDHTSDIEIDTEEDSAGSLVDFIVNDESSVDCVDSKSSDDEAKGEIVVSAVYENGVRRSTRNKKPVERYVDSDYEDLMCADADPEVALESTETEQETEAVEEEEEEFECTDEDTESDG